MWARFKLKISKLFLLFEKNNLLTTPEFALNCLGFGSQWRKDKYRCLYTTLIAVTFTFSQMFLLYISFRVSLRDSQLSVDEVD